MLKSLQFRIKIKFVFAEMVIFNNIFIKLLVTALF